MAFQIIKGVSHCDHISDNLLLFLAARYAGRTGFFIESFEIPIPLAWENNLQDALYGPINKDDPVEEKYVWYASRNGREWSSRLVDDKPRATRLLTVIAGPAKDLEGNDCDCVMYTAFGGPATPREVNDPSLPESERQKSIEFWSVHALSHARKHQCLACGRTVEKYAVENSPATPNIAVTNGNQCKPNARGKDSPLCNFA